jgi:YesN/AraC family two-component response regulator
VIQRVVAYLSDNYDKKITLSDLADLVHLTPNYLEFLFDKAMKQPVFSYLGNYRFHKSTELLLQSNLSIEEIAAKVGLTERKALIRLFKKNIGMTPLAYRKFYNQSHPVPENKNDQMNEVIQGKS